MRYWFLGLAAMAGACVKPAPTIERGTGLVSVEWDGVTQGDNTARAEGLWCAADSLLEVLAIKNDFGFGFTILPVDTLAPAQHPIVSGSIAVGWRPLAYGALRWVSDTALKGYEATGGTVNVTTVTPAGISGTVDFRLKHSDGFDTLRLSGTFTDVPVLPAPEGCGRVFRPKASSDD